MGFKQVAAAGTYNPAMEFDMVSGGCTVMSVSKYDDYTHGKPSKTWDRYTYTIAKNFNPSVVIAGINNHAKVVVTTGIDDTRFHGGEAPGTAFAVGANVTCWQKAASVELSFLDGFYSCGDDECLTIVDPQVTKDGNLDDMGLWLGLGAGEFTIGICGVVAMLFIAHHARSQARVACTVSAAEKVPTSVSAGDQA